MSALPRPTVFSRPFFEQKNRAFWMLQAAGWTGYLVLRSVSSISNGLSFAVIVAVAIESIIGYCITLLLSTLYGYYRTLPRIGLVLLTVGTLAIATALYAVLDAFSFSFIKLENPGINLNLVLGTIFLNFTVLAGWTALYFGINFYLIVEEQIDQLEKLGSQASSAQLAMLRYQLNPHFLFNTLNSISTLVLLKQTERANAMLSRLSSFLRYYARQRADRACDDRAGGGDVEALSGDREDALRGTAAPQFSRSTPRSPRRGCPRCCSSRWSKNAIKYAVTPCEKRR